MIKNKKRMRTADYINELIAQGKAAIHPKYDWLVVEKSGEHIYTIKGGSNNKLIHELHTYKAMNGYITHRLCLNNAGRKGEGVTTSIHRLVAETFIPNPYNLPEVNHIDGNKLNNDFSNLEWCTHQQNIDAYRKLEKYHPRGGRHVKQYDMNGNFIKEYPTIAAAQRFVTPQIPKNSQLRAKMARNPGGCQSHGYIWKFAEEE